MHHPPTHCAHIHSSVRISEYQWMHLFPHGGIQWRTFASYTLPCQTAPLLPSVTQQQKVMEYWWEGSTSTVIPPTSVSNIVGQDDNIEGITFGTALLLNFLPQYLKKTQKGRT